MKIQSPILYSGLRTRYSGLLRPHSGGCSDYSINLLKRAGIDMTTPAPVEQALSAFGQYVTELEQLAEA